MTADPSARSPEGPDHRSVRSCGLGPGDEIVPGRYALEKLGGGYDYEVYLAWDDHLSFTIVAKLLRPHLLEDAGARDRLRREAEMLGRLAHPLLVRGFGGAVDGDRPHVVLEHLQGPHLARLIRKFGPLPLEQLLPLAIDLCSAISYMTAEGVVHLDVKPRNVVVGVPPRLIDLSVARTIERAARIRGYVGTDAYMAPEQCDPEHRGPVGAAADVWGIGATLHHAVTGRVPFPRADGFDASDVAARFPQLDRDPLPLPKQTPTPVASIITRALEKDPSARPSPMDMALELEPLIAALPRRPVLGRLRPRLRRR